MIRLRSKAKKNQSKKRKKQGRPRKNGPPRKEEPRRISTILTSASAHDSQAAIPLAQMSSDRVTNCYDLMDAVYDAPEIHEFSKKLVTCRP